MAMNKKEQAELARLQEELRIAKAFRFTEPVQTDVPPPGLYSRERLAIGWQIVAYINGGFRAEVGCSSASSHAMGCSDKTNSQGARRQYSSKLRALKAIRNELERRCAQLLSEVDKQIEQEQST